MSDIPKPSRKKITKKISSPSYYDIVIYTDEITPHAFIQSVLEFIFKLNEKEIEIIFDRLYKDGRVIVGSYIKEVAITKQYITDYKAKKHGFPLPCLIEISKNKK